MAAILLNSVALSLALVGGRVYPSPDAAPVPDAVVLVDAGQIAVVGPRAAVKIPDGVQTLDCTGLVIVAGFQNSHVHFTEPSWENAASQPAEQLAARLRAMLVRFGFTTVVDTASELANTLSLRRRIEAGEVPGPRILTAGFALYPPDGVPYYVREVVPPELLRIVPQPRTPGEARSVVERQLSAGGDIVKLFTGSWVDRRTVKPMPLDIARAAVDAAHAKGRLVFTHPSDVRGLEVALDARVDVLAHAVEETRGLSDAHLQRMKRQNVALVPTLRLFRGSPETLDQVRRFARLGGDILFGTDVGFLPPADEGKEYEFMAAAGLGWREILASLTTTPARRFGEERQRGQVAPGMAADLVVLGSDPTGGVRAFADVRHTIRGGRVMYSASKQTDQAAERELREMQQRLRDAIMEGRREDYAAMLDDSWRVTHVNGQVLTKAQVLDMVFGGTRPPAKESSVEDLDVRVYGDAAVVTGKTTWITWEGPTIVLRFTDTLVKRNGKWVAVASHATTVE